MKRVLSLGLVLVLCLSLLTTTVAAEATPTIQVPDLSGAPGETVSVPIAFRDNPGLISAKIAVGYDTTALRLVGYDQGTFPAAGYSFGATEKVPFVVNFCDGIASQDYTAQEFVTLHFQILENAAAGTYPLTLTCDFEGDFYNYDWETVPFAVEEGSIAVLGSDASASPSVPASPSSPTDTSSSNVWSTLIPVIAAVAVAASGVVVCVWLRKKKANTTPTKEDKSNKLKK